LCYAEQHIRRGRRWGCGVPGRRQLSVHERGGRGRSVDGHHQEFAAAHAVVVVAHVRHEARRQLVSVRLRRRRRLLGRGRRRRARLPTVPQSHVVVRRVHARPATGIIWKTVIRADPTGANSVAAICCGFVVKLLYDKLNRWSLSHGDWLSGCVVVARETLCCSTVSVMSWVLLCKKGSVCLYENS